MDPFIRFRIGKRLILVRRDAVIAVSWDGDGDEHTAYHLNVWAQGGLDWHLEGVTALSTFAQITGPEEIDD